MPGGGGGGGGLKIGDYIGQKQRITSLGVKKSEKVIIGVVGGEGLVNTPGKIQ